MKYKFIKHLFMPAPLILISLVLLGDLILGLAPIVVRFKEVLVLREILLGLLIVSVIPLFKRLQWIASKNIVIKTRTLFFCLILSAGILLLFPAAKKGATDYYSILGNYQTTVWTAFLSISFALCNLAIAMILYDFIYVRRKKSTRRNFWLLIGMLVIFTSYILYAYLQAKGNLNGPQELARSGIGSICLGLLIMVMVVNGFRNSWINYLNKRQKVRYLFISLVFTIGWPLLIYRLLLCDRIVYSLVFEFFALQIGLLLVIYWAMAFVAILFHLPTAGIMDRQMKEIHSLHALSRTISSEFDFSRLVVKITELSMEVTEAGAAWLEIVDPQHKQLRLVSAKNLDQKLMDWINQHPDLSVGAQVFQRREPLWVNEVRKDPATRNFRQIGFNADSLLAVPVIFYGKILGVLCVLKSQEYGFFPDDLNMLRAFADQAAAALENSSLVQTSIEKERLTQELKVAHEAQMKLLPKAMPQIKALDIDAVCITANDVGGDYYDFFNFSHNRLGIVIGDVSGKGAEAAFYMAEVKGIIKSLAHTYISPKEVLIRTNEILFDSLERKFFISLIYAVIDLTQGKLIFSRAGHCPLFYSPHQTREVFSLEPKGLGIGLCRNELFGKLLEEYEVALTPGDSFLLFTDGVVEAMNARREEFEESRLRTIFGQVTPLSAAAIIRHLVQEVQTFVGNRRPHDDLTMVVVKVVTAAA